MSLAEKIARAKTDYDEVYSAGYEKGKAEGGGGGSVEGYVTVTFMNGGEVLFSRMVLKGDDCPDPYVQNRIELPTKESTAQYDYTFNGWATADGGSADTNALKGITEDKTLYAAYTSAVRYYTVTYYDEDGVTVLHTEQLAYGTTPSYVPTKEGAAFGGWTPNAPVTGDMSYTASWSPVLASGKVGSTVYWSLGADYKLTIYGSGKPTSDVCTKIPSEYKNLVTTVVVEEGITGLYLGCFSSMTGITSVVLPSSLSVISQSCFDSCTALTSIAWGGVTQIEQGAFEECKSLQSITIPSTVTRIYNGAFASCSALTSVVLPSSLSVIPPSCFSNCYALTNITIPNSVTEIGASAFYVFSWNASSLASITIPSGVTKIGKEAFSGRKSLTSVTFEDTEGWTAGDTALASADLANPATAATYLTNTYKGVAWTKS